MKLKQMRTFGHTWPEVKNGGDVIKEITEIKIRNMPPDAVYALTKEARRRGMSREEYCRRLLLSATVKPELLELDEKYNALTQQITSTLQEFSAAMNELLKKEEGIHR